MNKKSLYTTVSTSTSISINIICSLLILLAVACSNKESTEDKKEIIQQKRTEDKKIKKDFKLTDDNAVKFLNSFGDTIKANEVRIHTSYGDIEIELYNNTPLHRSSFIYLIEENYFNDTWFHRVSKGHVIQAGNTDERATQQKRSEIGDYTIPAEMNKGIYHHKGAVAAVRSYNNNPEKKSDPFEFYIVLGQKYSDAQLNAMEDQYKINLNEEQKRIYRQIGGSPHLDGEHTVFGKVTKGMEVVEKINEVKTDEGEWPMINIPIQVEVVEK